MNASENVRVQGWVKKLRQMPEVVGWLIDEIQGYGLEIESSHPVLQAAAILMKQDLDEIDWQTIDPYEVVLRCSTKRKAEDFDWSDFENGQTRAANRLYPNRHGVANEIDNSGPSLNI